MGMRFAMLEIKIGLVHTLLRYQILPCEKTEVRWWYMDMQA